MNIRTLGILGIMGGASLTAVEMRHLIMEIPLDGRNMNQLDELLYILWGLGSFCAFWAIYRLGGTGRNKLMRAIPFIAMVGFAALAIGSILDVIGLAQPSTNPVFYVAYPFLLIGTLLTAIFALIARTWLGWRKFVPLLCVLAIPAIILLTKVIGDAGNLIFGLSWILLGFAVLTSEAELTGQVVAA
jgi:hypothetical protein